MNLENIASSQTLLHMVQSGQCRALPEVGDKLSGPPAPEHAWLPAQQQRARTEHLFSLVAEPLAVKRSELITAAWQSDKDRAELAATPGKFWQYMGYEQQRHKFLHWEETIMLCEMGVIQMTVDGQPCSLQEVRARLLAGSAQRERQYRLYAYLTRLGYHPVRHKTESLATEYERKIRLDQYIRERKSKRRRAGSGVTSPEPKLLRGDRDSSDDWAADAAQAESEDDPDMADAATVEQDRVDDRRRCVETGDRVGSSSPPPHDAQSHRLRGQLSPPSTDWSGVGTALERLDFTAEMRLFPNFSQCSGRVTVRPPPADLLPPGVAPRNEYSLDVAAVRRGRRPERSSRDSPRDRYPSCLPVINTPVSSWTQFKQQAAALAASEASSGQAMPGDGCRSDSLVPPAWRGTAAELLARLRLAPSPAPAPVPVPAPVPLYDVYAADAPFRKSAPPLPELRVFVVRPDDQLSEVAVSACEDGVPLCAAVVADTGTPALYTVQQGVLPIECSVLDQLL